MIFAAMVESKNTLLLECIFLLSSASFLSFFILFSFLFDVCLYIPWIANGNTFQQRVAEVPNNLILIILMILI